MKSNGTNNGSITLSPSGGSGGFDYDWDTDGTGDNDDPRDLTGLLQGTYNLTLFDSANNICRIDTFFTITEPSGIFIGPTILYSVIIYGTHIVSRRQIICNKIFLWL